MLKNARLALPAELTCFPGAPECMRSSEAIPDGIAERFTTEKELDELAAQWPAARLIDVWKLDAGTHADQEVHQPQNRHTFYLEGSPKPRTGAKNSARGCTKGQEVG